MLARYAKIRQATWAPRDLPEPKPAFRPQSRRVDPVPQASVPIPAPDREVTLAAFHRAREVALRDRKPLADLMRIVCVTSGLERTVIKSVRRTAPLVKARQIAMYLMVRQGLRSLPEVGRFLGGRDHTTALHGVRKVEGVMRSLDLAEDTDPVELATALWSADWSAKP